MKPTLPLLLVALLGTSFLPTSASASQDAVDAAVAHQSTEEAPLADDVIADHQVALLALAYETASKMPLMPHVKNRSRAQERVLVACLELDQPARALAFAEGIANWRKGAGIADVACYAAEHGPRGIVPGLLERAEAEAVRAANEPNAQEWRPARIRAKVARAWALLGDFERAVEVEAGVQEPSEVGLVEGVRVARLDEDQFESKMKEVLALCEDVDFEVLKLAMRSFEQLHASFYADAEKRARIEAAADERFVAMPPSLRVASWMQMASHAIDHEDGEHAIELLDRARAVVDSVGGGPRELVPTLARLAALRHRAGQEERALAMLEGALAMFEGALPVIEDYRRTEVLLPIAEAHAERRDTPRALATYARCLAELTKNPNARVRTDDLVDVCCSMARHGVEPNAELLEGLRSAGAAMQDPW